MVLAVIPTATRYPTFAVIRSTRYPSTSSYSAPKTPKLSLTPNPNAFEKSIKVSLIGEATAAALILGGGGINIFGGGSGGGEGSSGGRAGDEGSGWNFESDFWARFLLRPARAKDDDENQKYWDSHGLQVNIVVQLNKLSGFKKYKVSNISFFDRRRSHTTEGNKDFFFEMVTIQPEGIYTKTQLQKDLETLAGCGIFEKANLDAKTNPNGTVGVKISFLKSTWLTADKFLCINVGLMLQSKSIKMDPDTIEKEKLDFYQSQEKDYRRRMDCSRPCLLPLDAQREIVRMLRDRGVVRDCCRR